MPDLILPVPYFSQRDSALPGQGPRMCFSSSCAMLLKYVKPKALPDSANADDTYLQQVFKFGDSTEAWAQIRALASLGLKAQFRQNLKWPDIDAQLAKNKPVPIGILHTGPATAPTGFGHWIVIVGRKADGSGYYVNDPYGELDNVNGGYLNSKGKMLLYSKKNLGLRWIDKRTGGGWGVII